MLWASGTCSLCCFHGSLAGSLRPLPTDSAYPARRSNEGYVKKQKKGQEERGAAPFDRCFFLYADGHVSVVVVELSASCQPETAGYTFSPTS